MRRHRRALITIAVACLLDVGAGIVFSATEHVSVGIGLYWALATASTTGYGDVAPHTVVGHYVAVVAMLTVIPLFASALSLFTSGLTAVHVKREGAKTQGMIRHVAHHHPDIPDIPPEPKDSDAVGR